MNAEDTKSYRHKSQAQLVKAIEETKTLSQLFALIQKEQIHIQMHAQSDASNITPTRIAPGRTELSPLERFKLEIKNAICPLPKQQIGGYQSKEKARLLQAIDECTSLSQLFALIQLEHIVVQMHAQSGASNLTPRKLTLKELKDMSDTPFERLKAEVRRSVLESDR